MSNAKSANREINFDDLGGRKVGHHIRSTEKVDLTDAYGKTGRIVGARIESEEDLDEAATRTGHETF